MKISLALFIALCFAAIVTNLFEALQLIDMNRSQRARYLLGMRVILSILLFIGLLLAYKLGWLAPTGMGIALAQR